MRRMTQRLALATMVLLSIGCSDSPAGPEPKPPPKVWAKGWHDAGLELSEGEIRSGAVGDMVAAADRLLVRTYSGKLYLSRPGAHGWDSLPLPNREMVYSIASDGTAFYVGGNDSGTVWEYEPSRGVWTDLEASRMDSTAVTALITTRSGLAGFFSRIYSPTEQYPKMWDRSSRQWRDAKNGWPIPEASLTALALGDSVYFGTWEVGLWRWTPQDSTWVRLPDPIVQTVEGPKPVIRPRSLALHGDRLFEGSLVRGLFAMSYDGSNPVQQQMDTVRGKYKSLTQDAHALLSHRGYLFVGGVNPFTPAVLLPGATGFLYLTDNWCRDDWGEEYICPLSATRAFAALGDTVYAAGGGRIMKIGLSDLPK